MSDSDALEDLNLDEMIELREIYEKVEEAFYVYTLIDQIIRWRLSGNDRVSVTSSKNAWRHDGSIVVFLNMEMQWIFPYSFDKTLKNIREALVKTQRIKTNNRSVFGNIHESYVNIILDIIKKSGRETLMKFENNLYAISIEEAATFDVQYPPATYIDKLNETHVNRINDLWYHKFENSDRDVRMYIEENGGYGLFKKDDNELMAWVLQGALGHVNILQTEEKYRGNGYGKLMLKTMAKHIAQKGHVPVATVLVQNNVSNNLFRKTGFETKGKSYFIVI